MKLVPNPGTLFYIAVLPRNRRVVLEGGAFGADVVKTIVNEDGSFKNDIFRSIANDGTHLVANKLTGYRDDKPMLFRIEDYLFTPVGPTVAKAMGFDVPEQEDTPVITTELTEKLKGISYDQPKKS